YGEYAARATGRNDWVAFAQPLDVAMRGKWAKSVRRISAEQSRGYERSTGFYRQLLTERAQAERHGHTGAARGEWRMPAEMLRPPGHGGLPPGQSKKIAPPVLIPHAHDERATFDRGGLPPGQTRRAEPSGRLPQMRNDRPPSG